MNKNLRLLKVIVQPVFALDDGETLTEVGTQSVEVSGADWPAFPASLEASRVEQESMLNAQLPSPYAHSSVRPEDQVYDAGPGDKPGT